MIVQEFDVAAVVVLMKEEKLLTRQMRTILKQVIRTTKFKTFDEQLSALMKVAEDELQNVLPKEVIEERVFDKKLGLLTSEPKRWQWSQIKKSIDFTLGYRAEASL